MGLKEFAGQQSTKIRNHGLGATPTILSDLGWSAFGKVPFLGTIGTNILSRDWDIAVILDACRYDTYIEEINTNSESIWSVGSTSEEWMTNTFKGQDTKNIAYITGNIFSKDILDEGDFAELREVWKYAWDDDEGTIPPDPITDAAIDTWRTTSADRMIVHYMQPHFPAIGSEIDVGGQIQYDDFGEGMGGIWDQIRFGKIDSDRIWNSYRDNLNYVWEEVTSLRNNVDGTVAITADHGNSFGKWGIYGHPPGIQIPPLRRVPWDTYECRDQFTRDPDIERESTQIDDDEVTSRLEHLGYV